VGRAVRFYLSQQAQDDCARMETGCTAVTEMAVSSAPYTHPVANRRYRSYLFDVDEVTGRVLHVYRETDINRRRVKVPCQTCRETGTGEGASGLCMSCRGAKFTVQTVESLIGADVELPEELEFV
jgi:hypothetical protein